MLEIITIVMAFKYKIVEFKPSQKMENEFNELGKDGWELVSVAPVGLSIKGDYDSTFGGVGSGDTSGEFTKIAAYFKKAVEK